MSSSIHKQILDPLSTLCKIASLSFYDSGSKISVSGNTVEIQRADSGQWLVRRWRGFDRDHISLLYNPIIKSIQWYLFVDKKELAEKDWDKDIIATCVKNIIKYAIEGLSALKTKTYKEGNVALALQLLINNLQFAVRENINKDIFEDYYGKFDSSEESLLNYDKIKEIWNVDTIKSVSDQLTLCNKNREDSVTLEFMLESLNLMLKNTDTKFKKLVSDMNASL